ncbi:MAG: FtsW/RodA/SpoVE family cell cycle protein, partial [Alphaproteobacteria bacterium]
MDLRALFSGRADEPGLVDKFLAINWGLVLLIAIVSCIGFAMQYSAAGGSMEPWAGRQVMRFGAGLVLMLAAALVHLRWWHALAYPVYAVGLAMLVAVEVVGRIGMGAQRWIDLGFFQFQPTELMKLGLVLVLARHFHAMSQDEVRKP